jgi:carbamoyltransferase
MEFGPRALGNRSILADPRDARMKDIINEKVKRRESFRPFAPAVLEEDASSYFEMNGLQNSPFMLFTVHVREDKRAVIPAVTHVDGTARVQTVSRRTNVRFWNLISEFRKITGVPVVLNTSFNVKNEPIVCSPTDALRCFLSTNIDCVVLGDYFVEKNS